MALPTPPDVRVRIRRFDEAEADNEQRMNTPPSPRIVANLDDTELTVEFTIAEVHGITQPIVDGQAPIFGLRPASQEGKRLTVWVVGELANDLDRLQMGRLQDNQLNLGTEIRATGRFRDSSRRIIEVDQLQNFRILPQSITRGVPK